MTRDKVHFYPVLYILTILSICTYGCGSGTKTVDPTPGVDEKELMPVSPDGRLETVTWNLEWYGSGGNGPDNEDLQTQNILQVIDSLKADLYAFQEVFDQEALNRIVLPMKGYRGFVSPHISWIQKTAFVYNTATIDSISAGSLMEEEGQNRYDWANGRFPLFFEFDYRYQNQLTRIFAIVIHAKAFDDQESYQRRKQAARTLYRYLTEYQTEARIILLGDYNDDVDVSIYDASATPYEDFVTPEHHFRVVTKSLSDDNFSSTVHYPDMVDHITISNELFNLIVGGSEQVYTKSETFIPDYTETTSDHYPVWAKFNLLGN